MKFFLGYYTKRKGKELNSDALLSSGADSMFDSVISVATVVSAVIMITTGLNIDCWLAAIISCLIIKAGIEMLIAPISELLGMRTDPELTNAIKAKVKDLDGVRGVFDVVFQTGAIVDQRNGVEDVVQVLGVEFSVGFVLCVQFVQGFSCGIA